MHITKVCIFWQISNLYRRVSAVSHPIRAIQAIHQLLQILRTQLRHWIALTSEVHSVRIEPIISFYNATLGVYPADDVKCGKEYFLAANALVESIFAKVDGNVEVALLD